MNSMTTSIDHRSGTINEGEDADACVEMQICDICGDAGYDNELAVCSRCNDSAEHIYCMATMHVRVPTGWVCEQCELEEKASTKKRFAGNGPISNLAYKKQNTKELSSCSVLSEGKNILVQDPPSKPISCESRTTFPSIISADLTAKIEPKFNPIPKQNVTDEVVTSTNNGLDKKFCAVEKQVPGGSNMNKNVRSLREGRHAVQACLSTFKQGEAVAPLSATLRGPSGCLKSLASGDTDIKIASEIRTARESSIKGEIDTALKGASNHARFPPDASFSGSKCVFSRSVSMKCDDDQPSFLLSSQSKNFMRSKSAVVRPSACWTSEQGLKKDLPLAKHAHARQGTTCIMDRTNSRCAGPARQAGQIRVTDYSWDLESPHHRSSRDSGSLQHGGSNDQECRRCYRCHEVGHIAARCKNVSSGRPGEWESSRGPATSEKCIAGGQSTPESPLGLHLNKEGGSLKESLSWKSQCVDMSGTWSKPSSCASQQIKISGKERLDRTETENANKEDENSSWKLHSVRFSGTCSKPSSNTSPQINTSGKERLDRIDTVNTAVKLSQKSSENALVLERQVAEVQVLDGSKRNAATSSSPSFSSKTGKQVSSQGIAVLQQAQGVDIVTEKYLQAPQLALSHVQIQCENGMLTPTVKLDLAADTSLDSSRNIQADPCVEMLWSGCFNVSSDNCVITYKGMQAHPSTKADPRVFEAIKTLPSELNLEELKRGLETDTWPRSLEEKPPTSNSIGVYFFPVDMQWFVLHSKIFVIEVFTIHSTVLASSLDFRGCLLMCVFAGSHDIWYKPLVDRLSANDLALKTNLDWFQLVIFPSQLLPQAEQCWEDRQYLWGILRRGTSFKTLRTATLGGSQ